MMVVYVYNKNTYEYVNHYIPPEHEQTVLLEFSNILDNYKHKHIDLNKIECFINFMANNLLFKNDRDFVIVIHDEKISDYKKLFDEKVRLKLCTQEER